MLEVGRANPVESNASEKEKPFQQDSGGTQGFFGLGVVSWSNIELGLFFGRVPQACPLGKSNRSWPSPKGASTSGFALSCTGIWSLYQVQVFTSTSLFNQLLI